ncbi:MAG: DUF433 domain-containing protein [Pyrinomonadaceae bacterium]
MNSTDRIVIDPDILNGKPSIRGTRISVQTVLEFLSAGDSIDEVLENYPSLSREDVYACLGFASTLLDHNFVVQPS